MTDASQTPPVLEQAPQPAKKSSSSFLLGLIVALLLVAGGIYAGLTVVPAYFPHAKSTAVQTAGIPSDLEGRVQSLESRVSDLSSRVDGLAANSNAPVANNSLSANPAELSRVQSDVASLSTALSSLQSDIKAASGTASALRNATHAALAEAITYLQLRDAAMSGRTFTAELDATQKASLDDPGMAVPLGKLAPLADKGAPAMDILRERLDRALGEAEVAIAKTKAESWWQRLVAELRGLVRIRPIHGEAEETDKDLSAMQAALAKSDIAAAFDAMSHLPNEAQQALADWRTQAEARKAIDDALQDMSAHLVALSRGETAPIEQPVPTPAPKKQEAEPAPAAAPPKKQHYELVPITPRKQQQEEPETAPDEGQETQ